MSEDVRIEAAAEVFLCALKALQQQYGPDNATGYEDDSTRIGVSLRDGSFVDVFIPIAAADAVPVPPLDARHTAYADPLGGGWDGYQAACWDCDWRSEAVHNEKALAQDEAIAHADAARAVPDEDLDAIEARAHARNPHPDIVSPANNDIFALVAEVRRARAGSVSEYQQIGMVRPGAATFHDETEFCTHHKCRAVWVREEDAQ